MKIEQNPKAKQSRNAIIWGGVLGVVGTVWLFFVAFLAVFGLELGAVIVDILLGLVPVGLLVFGLIKGQQANREIRENLETNEKYQVTSLVIAKLILIVLIAMIVLVIFISIATVHQDWTGI